MTFLRNTWYVAAWSQELQQDGLLRRKILGEPVVLFRDRDNAAVALIDRCSHRFAPLSLGKIVDSGIQCPYHGFRFSPDGKCVHNPHGDGRIPARADLRSFPLVEKYSAVWIWIGDPERADPEKMPVFDYMNTEDFFIGKGSMKVAGNYLLENDNILDLSHIEFVHPVFSSPAVSKGEVSHEIIGDTVWSKRDIFNDESPPEFIRAAFKVPEGPVDRWLHVHWQAPAYMALYAGGVASGQPREIGIVSVQAHWFTPEDLYSTHYFYAVSLHKSMGPDGQAFAEEQVRNLYAPFKKEDAPLIEAQQVNVGDRDIMDMQPIVLNIDAAGNAARRILARMIANEEKVEFGN